MAESSVIESRFVTHAAVAAVFDLGTRGNYLEMKVDGHGCPYVLFHNKDIFRHDRWAGIFAEVIHVDLEGKTSSYAGRHYATGNVKVWWDVDEAGNIYSMRHASQYQYNGDDAQGLFFPNKYEFVRINPDGTEHSYGVHECFPEFPEEWDPEQLVRIDQKQRFYFMRPVAAVDSVSGCSWDMEFVRINEDGTEFSLGVHCVDLKDHWTVSHVVWAVSGDGTLTIWKGKDLYNVAEDGAVSHLLSFNNSSLPPWLVMENENFFIRNTNPKSDEWDHDGFVRINKDGTMCSLGYGVGAFDSRGNLYRMEGETLMRYSDSDKGVSIVTLNGSAPCRVYPYSKGLVLAIKEDDRWHLYSIEVR